MTLQAGTADSSTPVMTFQAVVINEGTADSSTTSSVPQPVTAVPPSVPVDAWLQSLARLAGLRPPAAAVECVVEHYVVVAWMCTHNGLLGWGELVCEH